MRLGPAVALTAILLGCTLHADPARFVSSRDLPRDVAGLGGLSGLEVSEDGATFTALSDRGMLFSGAFTRGDGAITGMAIDRATRLFGTGGGPLVGTRNDPEGLAIGSDGTIHISFENRHRVDAYDAALSQVTPLPRAPEFLKLQPNSGLEALAIDPQDRLYAIPERSGHVKRPFPVWRLEGDTWQEVFDIPRRPPFLPVGADFGPDGRLYLLERHFSGLGFTSRVRAFTLDGDRITAEEEVLKTRTWEYGNLEGLAVWQDATGAIRLTMVADDNFMDVLPSQVVEYVLPLAGAPQTH